MKTLIVSYSWTHNNDILANTLQRKLHCDLLKLEGVKKRWGISIMLDLIFNRTAKLKNYTLDIHDYDHCILIAPIWAGKIATPLKAFIKKEKAHIKDYSFISVCGGGNPTQQEKLTNELSSMLMGPPVAFCELWVNDLMAGHRKNPITYTSVYRIGEIDLSKFETKINSFLNKLNADDNRVRRYAYSAAS